jgi:hypothetical protein
MSDHAFSGAPGFGDGAATMQQVRVPDQDISWLGVEIFLF